MFFPLVLFQKQKKKKKPEVFNFSAIHLIHDPQGITIMTSQVPFWPYLCMLPGNIRSLALNRQSVIVVTIWL